MKNIIYLSNSIIPSNYANSVHVMKMCQAFKKKNINIELLFYSKHRHLNTEKIFIDYGINFKFTLIPIFIKFERLKFFLNFFKIFFYLLKKPKDHLIYGRDIYSVFLASIMGFKVCYESHGLPYRKFQKILENILFKKKNFISLIVISEQLKKFYMIKNFSIKDHQFIVLHDGADTFAKNLFNDIDLGQGFHVGYVGSLHRIGRGIDLILQLAIKLENHTFHILGGNKNDIEYWQSFATKNVKFYGHLSNNIALQYIEKFHVAIMPYQENLNLKGMKYNTTPWMSPMKLFEYMSASKAIISSDFTVLREILNDKNSILVEPSNKIAWFKALKLLESDNILRKQLSLQAKKDFEDKYTWDRRLDVLLLNLKFKN